eukprot:CAMPEP_0180046470 /NCGR_PEP_ID=MMETSP0984-20121128/37197_1 /TAXON_ID=483367 /ORGANISM="non described non described, Strain CCMP 2436" /LENGTH=66 /DNA_ID=CAMNT_0021975153 /DNA_START=30 /DNA_END=228 /DNA_ORIENTATION=-
MAKREAPRSAEWPSRDELAGAPAASSSSTTAACPPAAARTSGENPSDVSQRGSAPASSAAPTATTS